MSARWRPVLEGSSGESAKAVAREVGDRLRDPDVFVRAIASAPTQSAAPEYAAWRPVELAQGHPGLAITFAQLDACFPHEGWNGAAHAQVELAVAALRN